MRNRPNSALLLLVGFFAMLWSLEASANTLESVHKWSLQSRRCQAEAVTQPHLLSEGLRQLGRPQVAGKKRWCIPVGHDYTSDSFALAEKDIGPAYRHSSRRIDTERS